MIWVDRSAPATPDFPTPEIKSRRIRLIQLARDFNGSAGTIHQARSLEDAFDVHVRLDVDLA